MFGHAIRLNFDREGNVHNTYFGGVFSIMVRMFMLYYIAVLIFRVAFKIDPEMTTTSNYLDVSTLGKVNVNETSLFFFHEYSKQMNYYYNYENLRQYVDIYYMHTYYKYEPYHPDHRIEVRPCTQDDFGSSQESTKFFNKWTKNDHIICQIPSGMMNSF